MEKKHTLLFLLVLGTAFWGISFSVTKLAIGHNSPFLFLFYRFLVATAVLTLIFWRQVKKMTRTSVVTGAALALPLMMGISLQTLGIKYSTASQCAFIAGTSVIIIPILKWVLYRKAAPVKIWLAALIALAGLFVISVKGKFEIGIGDLFTLAGSLGFAVYLIQVERQSAKKDLIPAIVPMFGTCAVLTLGLIAMDAPTSWLPHDHPFWLGIVFCALFSTAYMYTISNISQRYISAERVAIIYLFEPVFGAIAAFFILNEALTGRLLAGGALIFAATLIAECKFKFQKESQLELSK
jgi:drug/metabolite transporter (DMT)-like permease